MSDSKNKKAIKQHDFTKGDILKPIILFSLPVFRGHLFSLFDLYAVCMPSALSAIALSAFVP